MPYADKQSVAARASAKSARDTHYQRYRLQIIARATAWNKANPERRKTYRLGKRAKAPIHKVLFHNAQARAKAKGIEFSLTFDDIVVPEHCPVLGMRLVVATDNAKPDSPSLDRINPKLGYIAGNVQVISHKANTLKSDATLEELEALVAYMRRNSHG